MKFATLLAILSVTAVSAPAFSADDETMTYCNEQAALAGIEDAEEKQQYIKECVESFGSSSGDENKAAD